MEDETGLGILTGMLYETRDYLIYPVVNAQNLIAANFPVLTEENTAQMQETQQQLLTVISSGPLLLLFMKRIISD